VPLPQVLPPGYKFSEVSSIVILHSEFTSIFTNIVPTDVGDYTRNVETEKTIQEFQRQGGEAAEYANMMTELTKSQE